MTEKKKSKHRVFSSFFPIKIKRLMWSTENPVFRNRVFCALPREVERKEVLSAVTAPYRMGHIGPRVPERSACSKRKDEVVQVQLWAGC